MPKTAPKKQTQPLDKVSRKRRRGRPSLLRYPDQLLNKAAHFHTILSTGDRWQRLWPQLLDAATPSDVFALLERAGVGDLREFTAPVLEMIPGVIRERTFPKERVERQIAFLSDSLAALGELSARHSRDSCTAMRRRQGGEITSVEFYIECSCGYQGPSRDHACVKCGAKIRFELLSWLTM